MLTKFVSKWSKKTDLDDDALSVALEEVSDANYEASLGGNLYKKCALKKVADYFLNLSEKEINEAIENNLLFEA